MTNAFVVEALILQDQRTAEYQLISKFSSVPAGHPAEAADVTLHFRGRQDVKYLYKGRITMLLLQH